MTFQEGDLVKGANLSAGKYLGLDKINIGDKTKEFHKVFDCHKNLLLYLPKDDELDLQKLPTKQTVNRYLKLMKSEDYFELDTVDGSRYKFFQDKCEKSGLKGDMEVYHDLILIKKNDKISTSERKLLNQLKERLTEELGFVLELQQKEVEEMITPIAN